VWCLHSVWTDGANECRYRSDFCRFDGSHRADAHGLAVSAEGSWSTTLLESLVDQHNFTAGTFAQCGYGIEFIDHDHFGGDALRWGGDAATESQHRQHARARGDHLR